MGVEAWLVALVLGGTALDSTVTLGENQWLQLRCGPDTLRYSPGDRFRVSLADDTLRVDGVAFLPARPGTSRLASAVRTFGGCALDPTLPEVVRTTGDSLRVYRRRGHHAAARRSLQDSLQCVYADLREHGADPLEAVSTVVGDLESHPWVVTLGEPRVREEGAAGWIQVCHEPSIECRVPIEWECGWRPPSSDAPVLSVLLDFTEERCEDLCARRREESDRAAAVHANELGTWIQQLLEYGRPVTHPNLDDVAPGFYGGRRVTTPPW